MAPRTGWDLTAGFSRLSLDSGGRNGEAEGQTCPPLGEDVGTCRPPGCHIPTPTLSAPGSCLQAASPGLPAGSASWHACPKSMPRPATALGLYLPSLLKHALFPNLGRQETRSHVGHTEDTCLQMTRGPQCGLLLSSATGFVSQRRAWGLPEPLPGGEDWCASHTCRLRGAPGGSALPPVHMCSGHQALPCTCGGCGYTLPSEGTSHPRKIRPFLFQVTKPGGVPGREMCPRT